MSTLTKLTRAVKKLEVPRPLKSATNNVQARNSILDVKINSVEDLIVLTEAVACQITQANYDRVLQTNVSTMYQHLKLYGAQLESLYKDFLDRFFVVFRNGSQDEKLDKRSRLHLLELIELRAKHWQGSDYMSHYYKHRVNHAEPLLAPTADNVGSGGGSVSPTLATPAAEPPTILGPGEIIKTSGKFIKPTKIPGKNYSKDEVVIRNADSGKVMGIKGRRVHMIEELSDTIISFQRVSPGAKERLVQITGPNEENVNHAKHLIGDTIRRNASPVRLEQSIGSATTLRGSASSLNSSASDESGRPVLGSKEKSTTSNRPLLHSFSTNDAALGEYKYTVTFGHHSIKITGNNLDIVKTAKLVLDEYFESAATLEQSVEGSGDFFTLSQRPGAALLSHDLLGSLGDEPSFLRASNGLPDAGDDEVFTNKPPEENGSEITFRRARFSRAMSSDKKEGGDERGSKTTYSYETMVHYAASPLSRAPPAALAAFPSDLQRKSCLQFDGEAYLKKVAAAGVTLLSVVDDTPDSPEPE